MSRSTPAAIARTIASYRPRGVSDETLTFARALVARAEPRTPERAKALLFAASRLASFAEAVGLCPSPEELLCEAVIERFLLQGTAALSPASRRTLRSNLRALGRALGSHPQPLPVPLGRERAKAPYSEAEIEGFLRLAACQPTEARRMRCSAVVCLGAGARAAVRGGGGRRGGGWGACAGVGLGWVVGRGRGGGAGSRSCYRPGPR